MFRTMVLFATLAALAAAPVAPRSAAKSPPAAVLGMARADDVNKTITSGLLSENADERSAAYNFTVKAEDSSSPKSSDTRSFDITIGDNP